MQPKRLKKLLAIPFFHLRAHILNTEQIPSVFGAHNIIVVKSMVNLHAVNPWHLFKQAQQVLAAQCILCFHQWIYMVNEGCSPLPSLQQHPRGGRREGSIQHREREKWERNRSGSSQLPSNSASPHL